MSERFYPPTEEELLKQGILTPQPSRAPYSPFVDFFEPSPAPVLTLAKSIETAIWSTSAHLILIPPSV